MNHTHAPAGAIETHLSAKLGQCSCGTDLVSYLAPAGAPYNWEDWKPTALDDPCLDCGTPTLGVLTLDNGTTVGIGMNRLGYDDGERNGWLCGECAGYECDACSKNIYLDEDITIVNEQGWNEKYHEECLTPEQRAMAINQGELEE